VPLALIALIIRSSRNRAPGPSARKRRGVRYRKGEIMSPWDVLEHLYDSEIGARLASNWDAGFDVWIGDGAHLP
jgi:hypothetical protein